MNSDGDGTSFPSTKTIRNASNRPLASRFSWLGSAVKLQYLLMSLTVSDAKNCCGHQDWPFDG
jgi:hypothetical protein